MVGEARLADCMLVITYIVTKAMGERKLDANLDDQEENSKTTHAIERSRILLKVHDLAVMVTVRMTRFDWLLHHAQSCVLGCVDNS